MDVSKSSIPSPLVYLAYFQRKKIILGKHIKVCNYIKQKCTVVESTKNKIIEKFKIPTNSENFLTTCSTCSSEYILNAFSITDTIVEEDYKEDDMVIKNSTTKLNQMLSYLRNHTL